MSGKMRATLAGDGRPQGKALLACSAVVAHRWRPMKTLISLMLVSAASIAGISCLGVAGSTMTGTSALVVAEPNDNRVSSGRMRRGVMTVDLDAVWAGWRPDLDVDTAVTVQAFAVRGKK